MNGFALPCPDGEDNEHNARDYLEDYIPDFRDTCDVSYYAEYGRYDQDPYMGSESLRGMKIVHAADKPLRHFKALFAYV